MKIWVPPQEIVTLHDSIYTFPYQGDSLAEWHAKQIEAAILFGYKYSGHAWSPEFKSMFLQK